MRLDLGMWPSLVVDQKCLPADVTNVQKGSGTIWTFDDELARLANVQIVPDPFWTLVGGTRWGDGLGVVSQSLGGEITTRGAFRLNHANTNICSTLTE